MDSWLFDLLNQFANRWQFLDYLIIFCAEYLPYLAAILFFILFLYRRKFSKEAVYIVFLSVVTALVSRFLIANVLKILISRPRPFETDLNVVQILPSDEVLTSFPSGHAAFFFPLAVMLYLFDKKSGIILFLIIVMMGIARITGGVHWPSDILGGAVIGVISALAAYYFLALKKKFLR